MKIYLKEEVPWNEIRKFKRIEQVIKISAKSYDLGQNLKHSS